MAFLGDRGEPFLVFAVRLAFRSPGRKVAGGIGRANHGQSQGYDEKEQGAGTKQMLVKPSTVLPFHFPVYDLEYRSRDINNSFNWEYYRISHFI